LDFNIHLKTVRVVRGWRQTRARTVLKKDYSIVENVMKSKVDPAKNLCHWSTGEVVKSGTGFGTKI
jgi:hypothetical protein